MTPNQSILDTSISMVQAGLSIIPIAADGSKAPDSACLTGHVWKPYQSQRATNDEVKRWFGTGAKRGVAVIGGVVSGHLEILDFDDPAAYDEWVSACDDHDFKKVLDRLPVVETPSGGRHVYYRCNVPVAGNQKLAYDKDKKIRIETRGEGGYVVAPPSPAECHPTQRQYRVINGDLCQIPRLKENTREALLSIAKMLNQWVDKARVIGYTTQTQSSQSGLQPGTDYNARGDYEALLERHGWTRRSMVGETQTWWRPGKHSGSQSATTNYDGCGLLHIWSSNAAPFEMGETYSPFGVYAMLEHAGDFKAAARELGKMGYGEQAKPKTSTYETVQAPTEFSEWPEVTPFETVDAIEFPIDALPERIRSYAREVATSLKVPVDAVGMTMIGAACAAQRGRCYVQVGDTHTEAMLLYVTIIAPPASRKTAILNAAVDPIRNAQFRLIKSVREENKGIAAKYEIDTAIASDLKKKVANSKDKYARQDLAAELVELTNSIAPPKSEPQLIADDVTPEGLASLMARQEDCAIAVLSDEGSFFDNVSGRYNKGKANTNLVCKSYDGSPATINRQNQEGKTLYLHRPSLSVVMMVQPGVIQGMAKGSTDFDERGFFARLTYSYPEFYIDDEYSRFKVDADVTRRYNELINALIEIQLPIDELEANGRHRLTLTGEALDEWATSYSETQRRMRDGGDLAWCKEWAGKLAGKAARIAGLFHLIDHCSEYIDAASTPIHTAIEAAVKHPISVRNVAAGWAVAEYMIPQAFKTFGEMRVDPIQQLADRLIKWIQRGKHERFDARTCQQGNRPAKTEEIVAALRLLSDHNYVRQIIEANKPAYVANPAIFVVSL